MFACVQAVQVGEFTGLSDTLIESNWQTSVNGGGFAGADFSTFLSTLNSHFLYQANSFTSAHGGTGPGTDEADFGTGIFSSGPTRTYGFSSGINEVTVTGTRFVPGGTDIESGAFVGVGFGSGESVTEWDIAGGGTEWHWTVFSYNVGFTSASYTSGGSSSGSYSTGATNPGGSGSSPPKGAWAWQTIVDTTTQIGIIGIEEVSSTWTVPTGSYLTSYDSNGQNSGLIPITTSTTFAVDSWQRQDTTGEMSCQSFSNSFIFDPDGFYRYQTIYVPVSNGTSNEWLWIYSQEPPFVSFTDLGVVTELFSSVDGEVFVDVFPSYYPMKVLSIFDDSTPDQTFFSSTINRDITDPIYPVEQITFGTEDPISITKTYFDVGQLPMDTVGGQKTYKPTIMSTADAGGWIVTFDTFAEFASKTTAANSFGYSSLPSIILYADEQGRTTTTSYVSIFSYAIPSGATQTSADFDYIVTASDTFQLPATGDPVRGGADINMEGQTIWGSYLNAGPAIYPADTIYFTGAAPTLPGLFEQQLFWPIITTGFQVPPYIKNSDPVFERVDADAVIDNFDYDFFNEAFIGQSDFDVAIPYQTYYEDDTGGVTGASENGNYTFEFASNQESLGQVSVTHQFGDTSNTESFIMQLAGGGNTIQYEITGGIKRLDWIDPDGNTVIFQPVFGGLPRAYGNAPGGDTVLFFGKFDTSDDAGGSGRQDFNWSFEMATDEVSAWSGVDCITAGTASCWGNSGAPRIYVSVANKYPDNSPIP